MRSLVNRCLTVCAAGLLAGSLGSATGCGAEGGLDPEGKDTGDDSNGGGTGSDGVDGQDVSEDGTGDSATGGDSTAGDDTGVDGTGGSTTDVDGSGGTGGDGTSTGPNYPPGCGLQGIELATQSASVTNKVFQFTGVSGREAPFDALILQSFQYSPYNGPTGPGTYDLSGINYRDCGLCLLAKAGCGNDGVCERLFYADIGTVTIDHIWTDEFKMKATLNNVIFREVEIDPETWVSTPVDGGDLWCIYETPLEVIRTPTADVCVGDGTGVDLNENIADYTLMNAVGEPVDLHAACGQQKAVQLMAATGWCPACTEAVPIDAAQAERTPGLDLYVLMGEDEYGNPPTQSMAFNYARSHDIAPEKVLIDSNWQTTFSFINPHLGAEIYLPWYAILDGDNMEYIYCDTCDTGTREAAIDALLAD